MDPTIFISMAVFFGSSSLKRLPGFEGAEMAVSQSADKKQALQMMEKRNVENLPVVNEEKRFAGIVDRSRLTASLIIDVANELKR
jgi:Mg/Co/Ni transporter MgtE